MAQFTYGAGTKSLAAEYKPTGKGQQKVATEPVQTGTPAESKPKTGSDYINDMYDSSMAGQAAQLRQTYEQGASNLDEQKEQAQKQADANLNRTYIEAEKARKNYAEVQNAYGLTSGAMGQAQLAMGNQLQADMTAIRTAQQEADAQIERERGILAKEYATAIARAQADNDLQRAQALYEEAKREEDRLLSERENAAALMAGVGDYSLYAQLYGLTPEQLARLQGENKRGGGGGGTAPYTPPGTNAGGDNPPGQAEDSLVTANNQPKRGSLIPDDYVGQSTVDFVNRLYGLK